MTTSQMNTPTTATCPETELLLCCARTRMDASHAERLQAILQKDINWAYLTEIARWHGLIPLLYWNLNRLCPEAVPSATLDQFRAHFQANTWRNVFLTGELIKLLKLLEAYGIAAIPYKGPALAASIYGNLSLREFGDLDILVQEHNILKATELLIAEGYQLQIEASRWQERVPPQFQYCHRLVRNDGRVNIELHWAIARKYIAVMLDKIPFWERLELVSLAGVMVPNLSSEDQLLFLCVHGSKHGPFPWGRLKWICDVAELLHVQPGIKWEQAMAQAKHLGSRRMVHLGLFLASDILEAPLPSEILREIQADSQVKSLAKQIRERLFSEVDLLQWSTAKSLFYLKMREQWRDKVLYFFFLIYFTLIPNNLVRLLRRYGLSQGRYLLRILKVNLSISKLR